MCDFSLQAMASRPAVVGETLASTNFGTGTRGFASPQDCKTAVCLLPGTELSFAEPVKTYSMFGSLGSTLKEHTTAIFRQINKDQPRQHHDCLEFPDGVQVLLTFLMEGQKATVLQLPAAPKTAEEAKDQERLEVVG